MVKTYFDINVLVDLIGDRKHDFWSMVKNHQIFTSTLAIHILMYVSKFKVPNEMIVDLIKNIIIIDFVEQMMEKAMIGPTDDFEDNVQLHSAVEADCDYFLTLDKKLLNMKYFGKMEIIDQI